MLKHFQVELFQVRIANHWNLFICINKRVPEMNSNLVSFLDFNWNCKQLNPQWRKLMACLTPVFSKIAAVFLSMQCFRIFYRCPPWPKVHVVHMWFWIEMWIYFMCMFFLFLLCLFGFLFLFNFLLLWFLCHHVLYLLLKCTAFFKVWKIK